LADAAVESRLAEAVAADGPRAGDAGLAFTFLAGGLAGVAALLPAAFFFLAGVALACARGGGGAATAPHSRGRVIASVRG
jgi:hypothetical protein